MWGLWQVFIMGFMEMLGLGRVEDSGHHRNVWNAKRFGTNGDWFYLLSE